MIMPEPLDASMISIALISVNTASRSQLTCQQIIHVKN